MKLETFVNLDHILSVEFSQDDNSNVACVIYYKGGEVNRLTGNSAMKFYVNLMRKIKLGEVNFVVIHGDSI
jgi:hypothetical protein